MKYLGLDLGSKTVGISISSGIIASVYETYRFEENNYNLAIDYIASICKKEKIDRVILGYPKHMNNDIGIRGQISKQFKKDLESKIDNNIKVILQDERLTSLEVNKVMIGANTSRKNRKVHKDELAAVIILQNYLDSKKEE